MAGARQRPSPAPVYGSQGAAFIGEPIQGAGGVIILPASYRPEIQRICDEYGILLISDEAITGFGRLGTWFGAGHVGTRPDFMPFACVPSAIR